MISGPLAGIRVLDLTTFLSGPFATQILGDLGADIIKVEAPEGDQTRTLPPYFVGSDSAYFLHVNRNKRSIAIDLKSPEGRAVIKRFIARSDVVVENFRPGVATRLGLDYSDLAKATPKLIWCSISGFGQTGPYSKRPAYDMIVQALSGAMSLTGERDGRPVRLGLPIGDLAAGMYSVIGILAALNELHRTGAGRQIDVAMLDGVVSLLSYQATYAMMSGVDPYRQGRGHDSIPTYRCFSAADGVEIAVTANTERMWLGLCEALGLPLLPKDLRFTNNQDRYRNRAALDPILEKAFSNFSSEKILARLHEKEVPAAPVATVLEALSDPQIAHRNMVQTLRAPDGRTVPVVGFPVRLGDTIGITTRFPPKLGEHGRELLESVLGMGSDDIKLLVDSGVIVCAERPVDV